LKAAPSQTVVLNEEAFPTAATRRCVEPSLFVGPDARVININELGDYLHRLHVLADLLRAARITVDQDEALTGVDLADMWEKNPDIRKRGLRGGSARKQQKMGLKYIPVHKMSAEYKRRRLEVEKTDYTGRTHIAALRIMSDMLGTGFDAVRRQQAKCHDTFALVGLHTYEEIYAATSRMGEASTTILCTNLSERDIDELVGIEDMFRVFNNNYYVRNKL
jgi:hypothetical protein